MSFNSFALSSVSAVSNISDPESVDWPERIRSQQLYMRYITQVEGGPEYIKFFLQRVTKFDVLS
jgi:hypothetical protein